MGWGFGDWLADRTGIHPTRIAHGVGSVLDNKWAKGALGAGLMATGVGAPLGAAIMGGAGALGGALKPGGGLRDALSGGAQGAGYGALAGGAGQALRNAFVPSSSAIGAQFGGGAAQAGAASGAGGGIGGGMANITAANLPQFTAPPIAGGGGSSLMSQIGGALRGAGTFAKENPSAVSAGLQGLGAVATRDSTNALNNAQAQRLAAQNQSDEYDLQTRKARDLALEPIRRALAGQLQQLQQNHYGIAPNPYGGGR